MYHILDDGDFVNENSSGGYRSNVLLKETGEYWKLKEFHENTYCYGYRREKKKGVVYGRAAEATDEQKQENRKRTNARRRGRVLDLVNCNESDLNIWHTYTYADNQQDMDAANHDRKEYLRRLERFCQTGRIRRKAVEQYDPKTDAFIPFPARPEFALKAVGVVQFQDGERRADKHGRGAIHFHQVMNTPFLPRVNVIVADVFDAKERKFKEAYLQESGLWSLAANRDTRWFSRGSQVAAFLREQKHALQDVTHKRVRVKPLCVAALLWEHGHIDIKTVQNMRKSGQCSNVGEYMVGQYMVKNTEDRRLDGHKAYFMAGDLWQPTFYRDPVEVERIMQSMDMWNALVNEKHYTVEYLGLMTVYSFNYWALVYPWIKTYEAKKASGERMTAADWLACQVENATSEQLAFFREKIV